MNTSYFDDSEEIQDPCNLEYISMDSLNIQQFYSKHVLKSSLLFKVGRVNQYRRAVSIVVSIKSPWVLDLHNANLHCYLLVEKRIDSIKECITVFR